MTVKVAISYLIILFYYMTMQTNDNVYSTSVFLFNMYCYHVVPFCTMSIICSAHFVLVLSYFDAWRHQFVRAGGGGHCYSILCSMYIFCKYLTVQCYIYIFFIIPFISTLLYIYFRKPPRKKQKRNVAINVAMRFKISNKFISNV